MALVISEGIRKKEFKRGAIPESDLAVILRGARADLAPPIKGSGLPPATQLLKVYATSPGGARRIVYLLAVEDGTLFLLFYRDKQDEVGANITLKNPAFKRQLHRHLDILREDIESGKFETHDLPER